ncbi:MAG: hypothetical protein WDA25_01060 [Paracoccaceae bacterium]
MSRIPRTFTDLVAAAVIFMPVAAERAGKADRERLRAACEAAAVDGAEYWPRPALLLWAQCSAIAGGEQKNLSAGAIGAATSVTWSEIHASAAHADDRRRHGWQERRDVG